MTESPPDLRCLLLQVTRIRYFEQAAVDLHASGQIAEQAARPAEDSR